jgi:hypothetical protein
MLGHCVSFKTMMWRHSWWAFLRSSCQSLVTFLWDRIPVKLPLPGKFLLTSKIYYVLCKNILLCAGACVSWRIPDPALYLLFIPFYIQNTSCIFFFYIRVVYYPIGKRNRLRTQNVQNQNILLPRQFILIFLFHVTIFVKYICFKPFTLRAYKILSMWFYMGCEFHTTMLQLRG